MSLPSVILFIILIINGDFLLRRPGRIFTKTVWREIASLCFHGLLVGFGSIAVLQLDSIMAVSYTHLMNRIIGLGYLTEQIIQLRHLSESDGISYLSGILMIMH